jgi:hypothetical protein
MKPTQSRKTGKRNPRKGGACPLKRSMKTPGNLAIDRRTSGGKALVAWRRKLAADLGGEQMLSAQQVALVESTVNWRWIVQRVDAEILKLPSLINKHRRTVHSAVLQCKDCHDALSRYLQQLGLERRSKEAADLQAYLAERDAEKAAE